MTLKELSEGYRIAAVLVRVQLDETLDQIKASDETNKTKLDYKCKILRQILKDMRDMRELTANYYTVARNRDLSATGIKSDRRNSLR